MNPAFRNKPCEIVEPEDEWIKARKKTWSHLIRQVKKATPLLSDCSGTMKIISVIESGTQSDDVGEIMKYFHQGIDFIIGHFEFSLIQPSLRLPRQIEYDFSLASEGGHRT